MNIICSLQGASGRTQRTTFQVVYSCALSEFWDNAAIEKIIGSSEFKGQYNDVVWCGRWDTRL
ncbi:MAG: hypothetical protein MR922_11480 [Lachnospiraceae bacterium]|nr:hypothetical protein [Lachnospiraceae bacterium]